MGKPILSYNRDKIMQGITNLDTILQGPGQIPPNTKRYIDLNIAPEEAAKVTLTKNNVKGYYDIIGTGRNCPPAIKDAFDLEIKNFRLYDHGPVDPHRIYEKIAIFGNITEWEILEIRGHTALEKSPTQSTGEGTQNAMLYPKMALRTNQIGQQLFEVTNPATPNSVAKPDKVSHIRIYRYIGFEPPKSLDDFKAIGVAKRGLFLSLIDPTSPDKEKKFYSHHYAKYELKDGTMSMPSQVVVSEVMYMIP